MTAPFDLVLNCVVKSSSNDMAKYTFYFEPVIYCTFPSHTFHSATFICCKREKKVLKALDVLKSHVLIILFNTICSNRL